MKMPCSRPRTSSLAAVISMLLRNAEDTMSAAPPMTSIATATPSMTPADPPARPAATPNSVIASPHTMTAQITARP